ncbi:hypothetical protein HHI36_002990 [Cryptolaemus montrouzieri]|uniref:Poly [ADP-ribose] polymerase n=1 Tax=Cryptolaemus montrouzieri TaxID=559131 RepID=A0ABD2PCN1_9CUCU
MSYSRGVEDLDNAFKRMGISASNKYNKNYFPKSKPVLIYYNKSENKPSWVRHPHEEEEDSFIWKELTGRKFEKIAGPISNDYDISISEIYKNTNKYLERQYKLKKQKRKAVFGFCEERIMYHATDPDNVDEICSNNFNWRLSGQSRGHKYGYGVSFTPEPSFSHQFCKEIEKALVVTKVLICKSQIGSKDMILPSKGFDTTRSKSKKVFVKFEDSEFYPAYVVFYTDDSESE